MKLAGGRIMPDKVKNRKTMEPLGKMVFYGPGLMYNPIMAYFSELLTYRDTFANYGEEAGELA